LIICSQAKLFFERIAQLFKQKTGKYDCKGSETNREVIICSLLTETDCRKTNTMKKQWLFPNTDTTAIADLQKKTNLDEVLCHMLIDRGIKSPAELDAFFEPKLENLYDPFLLKDMYIAVGRLNKALESGEKILIYGDYDVDGTTSVAMLYTFLEPYHEAIDFYIPDRYKEGYGVSMQGIQYAIDREVSLIMAVDCGIQAVNQVAHAKEHNIDFIICDHHLPGNTLPNAVAILNPQRSDCSYPFKGLCGCGVAFKFIQGFATANEFPEEAVLSLLDFVAVATACDIVPLLDENRILMHFGLKSINQTAHVGFNALIRESGRKTPMTVSDLVFGLGPMINAAGRLSDAKQSVKMLLAHTDEAARNFAKQLFYRNEERKEMDRELVKEAEQLIMAMPDWESKRSFVLYQPHWHKGIVGIAASRIVDKFNRPAIILTKNEGKLVGSARSISGVDIHQAIGNCSDLLLNFGGHQYAAGLTLEEKHLSDFQNRIETQLSEYDETKQAPKIKVAGELELEKIDTQFYQTLRKFAPFGPGNRNPVFVSRQVSDTGDSRLLKGDHLQLQITKGDSSVYKCIAFGQGDFFYEIQKGPFDICYNLQENTWKNKTTLQLNVKDIHTGT